MDSLAQNFEGLESKRLGIVVPVFNRFLELEKLVQQLRSQSFQNFELIVVDHGSKDWTPPADESVKVLKRSSDLWFTGAVNEGLRELKQKSENYDFGMILNDDVVLSDNLWLEKMLAACGPREFVSSAAKDQNDQLIYSGLKWNFWKFRFEHLDQGQSFSVQKEKLNSDTLPTRGILFPINALNEVGLLNETELPQYGSDYEWTCRAKNKGYDLSVSREVFLKTELNPLDTTVSGRKKYARPRLKNFFKELLSPYKSGSLAVSYRVGKTAFSTPYLFLFVSYHFSRKVLGFLWTNYIRS